MFWDINKIMKKIKEKSFVNRGDGQPTDRSQ